MARKKSATKKAREAQESVSTSDNTAPVANEKKPVETKDNMESSDEASESASSDSEEEDEFGELITDDVEQGINKVLNAIKVGDKALFDPSVKFFDNNEQSSSENAGKSEQQKAQKPIYLKDYHRMNLLSGAALDEDDEENQEWPEGEEKPFVVQQREEKQQLLSEIKDAFNGDEDDDENEDEDENFLQKKDKQRDIQPLSRNLPNPEQDGDKFLTEYMNQHAWIPTKDSKEVDLDANDDDQFDDAVEKFEHAYNFRYEDPNAAEIVSYARNQATLRRSNTNPRKLAREREKELKEQAKAEKEAKLQKKKLKKVNMVTDRLMQIKEAVGGEVSDELIAKVFGDSLLKHDFDDAEWDSKMAQIFDEAFYEAEPTKPVFDDEDGVDEAEEEYEDASADPHDEEAEEIEQAEPVEDAKAPSSKKDKLKEKKSKKKEKEQIKKTAELIVTANTGKIIDELNDETEERGRKKNKTEDVSFRYREVSPETFGLTTREIFVANDTDLNNLIGIKKFAPYRPKEARQKDKRKLTKSYKLKEWRKQVFHNPEGLKESDDWGQKERAERKAEHKKRKLAESENQSDKKKKKKAKKDSK